MHSLKSTWLWTGVVALAFAVYGSLIVSPPISFDELVYISIAQKGEIAPAALNRLFHSYFQGIWMALAPTAAQGVAAYGVFLLAAIAAGTFRAGLALSGGSGSAAGFALLLLLTQSEMLAFTGVTFADFTVAALAIWLIVGTLELGRNTLTPRAEGRLLALLGAGAYFAIRSKESSVALVVLGLSWLAWIAEDRAQRARRLKALTLGAVIAVVLMVIGDAVFLGDALFSFRPSVHELSRSLYTDFKMERLNLTWWAVPSAALWFFFAVAIGIRPLSERGRFERAALAFPLAFLAGITFFMIRANYNPLTGLRYLYPMIAPLCAIGGAVALPIANGSLRRQLLLGASALGGALAFILLSRWSTQFAWEGPAFRDGWAQPFALAVFGILLLMALPASTRRLGTLAAPASAALLSFALAAHIGVSLRHVHRNAIRERGILRVDPLIRYAREIDAATAGLPAVRKDPTLLLDPLILGQGNLGGDMRLFNLYLDTSRFSGVDFGYWDPKIPAPEAFAWNLALMHRGTDVTQSAWASHFQRAKKVDLGGDAVLYLAEDAQRAQ